MNITLTVQTETAAELASAIHSLAGVLPGQEITGRADVTVHLPEEKPEKKPKKKEETPAAGDGSKIQIEAVREAAMKVKAKYGLDKVTEVLETLGKSRVVDLEPEQYASFLEKLPAL